MTFKSVLILLASFLVLSTPPGQGSAQERQKVYTLEESIAEAFANNLTLGAKKEDIDQAVQVKNQERTEFFPKLTTEYNYTRTSTAIAYFGPVPLEVSPNNYAWRTFLRQPIFTGFALLSRYELARLGIDQSETALRLEELDLALRVKESYFDILRADKEVEVVLMAVKTLKSNVDVARSFYEVKMVPINEVLKAEVYLANSQLDLVRGRNASQLARCAFNTILARPVNAPVGVEDILVYKSERADFGKYTEMALKNRPELKLLDINILQADQEIRLSKSKYYPEISFVGEYTKEGDTPDVSGSPFHQPSDARALAVLTWTLWEWGKTRYSVREKESLKMKLTKTRLALVDQIYLEVKEALLALEEAEENVPTTQKQVEQAVENLRVNEERYKARMTTITEVLDAQTLLSLARTNYYTAVYDHNLAKARLERAAGTY